MISQILGPVPPVVISGAVLGLAALVLFLSGKAYLVLQRGLTDYPDRQKMILFLVCLAYALIHPRLKDYAYMFLIVPSYYIMKTTRLEKVFPYM